MTEESNSSARDFFPKRISLTSLTKAAKGCRGCDLWKIGTQTVFGEGKARSQVVFVGEQPGDQEDRTGHPFIGPAGRLLDTALAEAGIARELAYVTNVVNILNGSRAVNGGSTRSRTRARSGLVSPGSKLN